MARKVGDLRDHGGVAGDLHLDIIALGIGVVAARLRCAEAQRADRGGLRLLGLPARQRLRQQRGEAFGVLLPDQLRGEIERLLGIGEIARLIGFARLIDGVEHVVGGKCRHGRTATQKSSGKMCADSRTSGPSKVTTRQSRRTRKRACSQAQSAFGVDELIVRRVSLTHGVGVPAREPAKRESGAARYARA